MKLVVVGCGQGGSNIADEFVAMAQWVYKNRNIRLFTGSGKDPICKGVFAINLGAGDLYQLKNIPHTDDHSILLGTTDEFRGRGAGKVNADGAEQARRGEKKIIRTIQDYGDVHSADAIMVIGTTAGGTGSGSVGVVCDLLKDKFNKPVYAMMVLPFKSQYNDPDSVVNTATCLKKVLTNSKADAVFLIDNQKFVRENESMLFNYGEINRRIANSFMDILCVGEETDRKYIGEVLDANDLIRAFQGLIGIGQSIEEVPPKNKSGFFLDGKKKAQHFSVGKQQIERAKSAVDQALKDLSIDCDYRESNKILYDADYVFGLFSGPSHEATEEIIEVMESSLAESVPGASRRKGTYPGRSSNTIAITVILSGIGSGDTMNRVQWFYEEAEKMMSMVKEDREKRKQKWDEVSRSAQNLPDL